MDKDPEAFRTISEVAEVLSTPAHVLRFWESRFPQIKPVKRAGGRRYYRPSDVALIAGIRRLLHDDGLTIRGVQKLLRDQGVRHVAGLRDADVALPDAFDALQPPVPATPPPGEVVELRRRRRRSAPEPALAALAEEPQQPVLDLFSAAPPAWQDMTEDEPETDDREVWLPTHLRRLPVEAFEAHQARLVPLYNRMTILRDHLASAALAVRG
jgi:DNA-binding transcriptional MerR regulator